MKLLFSRHYFQVLLCFIVINALVACDFGKASANSSASEEAGAMTPGRDNIEDVGIMVLKPATFKSEIISNGTLTGVQKTTLAFNIEGSIEDIFVKNGDIVQKGKGLAVLEPFKYERAFISARTQYEKDSLTFEDILISRGFELKKRSEIPDNIYKMALIRSGYSEAKNQLEIATFNLQSVRLVAPFKGKVADIKSKKYEKVGNGSPILTLIDDTAMEVEFSMVEYEVSKIVLGNAIKAIAFNTNKSYEGKIVSINPVVDHNGMVLVKALIRNDGSLIEGMNVKVVVQKDIPNLNVVPKSAVLSRQNKHIVFKYSAGKAYWTYIRIVDENSNSYAIVADPEKESATLSNNDTIIISGNFNLAHDSKVRIIK